MYCDRTICFKIRVIQFKLCCNSMTSQPLPNFKFQFPPKYFMGSYDKIALNQRHNCDTLHHPIGLGRINLWHRIVSVTDTIPQSEQWRHKFWRKTVRAALVLLLSPCFSFNSLCFDRLLYFSLSTLWPPAPYWLGQCQYNVTG